MASEFALVGVRKTRINELVNKGNTTAKLIQKALEHLDTYISATQLGITLASLALGWIGEPALAHFLEPLLQNYLSQELAFVTAHTLSVAIAFSFITFLHIVLGELAPKTIALQKAEKTSLFIILPLYIFTKVFSPFIWVLNATGNLVVRLMGLHGVSENQLVHSEEEIRMILDQSEESGAIKQREAEMVQNVFKLGDTAVKQIMVPRTDIVAFKVSLTVKELITKIRKHQNSRFPIYEHSIDTIIGFVHIKDVYQLVLKDQQHKRLSETMIIRPIIFVPEFKKADAVLLEMRKKQIHMAIVNDEYGGTAGVVTLEDLVESVIGEIEDEFEKPVKEIERLSNGRFLIDGLTSIEKVQEKFKLPLKGQGYTTIGGLVFGILGREPKVGDQVQLGNITLTIEEVEGKRIKSIILKKEKKFN